MGDDGLVQVEVLLKAGVRSRDLLDVPLRVIFIPPPAAQPAAEVVRIEVILILGKTRRVVSTHQPSRHPVPYGRQVGDAGIDMIPTQLGAATSTQCCLRVEIEFAQVVKRCRGVDRVEKTSRGLDRVAKHSRGPVAGSTPYGLDMARVWITVRAVAGCRVSQRRRCVALPRHPLIPMFGAEVLEAGQAV